MSIEQNGSLEAEQDQFPIEPTSAKEEQKDLERARRNINLLINSGKLVPEQAEKLAKLHTTKQIEILQEQAEPSEETLITKENGAVDFGEDENGNHITMKVFRPQPEEWKPKFIPTKDGRYLSVGFVSNLGNEFIDIENSQSVTDDDVNNPEVQAAIDLERTKLDLHLEQEKAKRHLPPEKRSEFKETEFAVENMRKIAHQLNHQEAINRGLLVIEGEAGTGKNWMIDHIGHLTERPIFRFTCDASKETPELKYILEYTTDEKGSRTVRINSTIVEALQTEGAILELDEINTLRPDVAKSLNSLFDADRALYFGEDDLKVKASRGVLLVGLMNPSNYAGVKPLAETIKSRARIMKIDYPPLHGEDESGDPILKTDEAELLFQYFPEFSGLSQDDFKNLWNQVVNGKESKNAQNLINQQRQLRITQLKTLVTIADNIREAYRQYQENVSGHSINYNFTLRESADCVLELAHMKLPSTGQEAENQARKITAEIFIPKLDEPEERKNIESLIGVI